MSFPQYLDLTNLQELFPDDFSPSELARAQTVFLKRLAIAAHGFYGGKMRSIPKAGIYGFGWFGVWYTPGVSAVSTAIRDNNMRSYQLSNRSNLVAVVSDSTRVLGDGDCTPSGGLGVMEGKAFLMYYLGGIDAISLCINTHTEADSYKPDFDFNYGKHDHSAEKVIDFVRMLAPSVGAVNLEDISQPNCFKALDSLQDCGIPVWHDDAQGTACVTLAGMLNAVKLAGKDWKNARAVFYGAGASNATIIRLMLAEGLDPKNVIAFDSKGGLHAGRDDLRNDARFYRKWQICQATNPQRVDNISEACKGADILCALSTPGPDIVKKDWILAMGEKPIVFVCANPIPEIYPHDAKDAGAFIVATGRSDFPNQVNNSMCFPGLLKGCLLVQASRVTDGMAIAAAHSLARAQQNRGLDINHIMPTMDDVDVFPQEASDVAAQAVKEGVARIVLTPEEVFQKADRDIKENRDIVQLLMEREKIPTPPKSMIDEVVSDTIAEIRGQLEAVKGSADE
ncbi:MAG: NADP-dependent malic enzyme [Holophagales bacterium]|jgi:malate dehydrogenase (oxaloacetate-decarboxylating)|nr:NADP-dependent malic enzyme [Holophagales bacterium]